MNIKIGKGTMEIGDKIIKLIGNKVLSVSVIAVQGACTDEMCPLIKKPQCNITKDFEIKDSYKIYNPVKVEMPDEMYYSIDKGRQCVKVKLSLNGKIEIKGLSLIGAV